MVGKRGVRERWKRIVQAKRQIPIQQACAVRLEEKQITVISRGLEFTLWAAGTTGGFYTGQ